MRENGRKRLVVAGKTAGIYSLDEVRHETVNHGYRRTPLPRQFVKIDPFGLRHRNGMECSEQSTPQQRKQGAVKRVRPPGFLADMLNIAAQGTKHVGTRVESPLWPRDHDRPGLGANEIRRRIPPVTPNKRSNTGASFMVRQGPRTSLWLPTP